MLIRSQLMPSSYAATAKFARNRSAAPLFFNRCLARCHVAPEDLPCVTFVLVKRLKMNVQISPNVLYSLPASLIHSIMTEWIEFSAILKLDVAVCQHRLRDFHLAFLSSDYFYIERLTAIGQTLKGPNRYYWSADTLRLRWLLARNVKVREFEFACDCQIDDVSNYLKKFGEHVQKVKHYTSKFHYNQPTVKLALPDKHLYPFRVKLVAEDKSHGSIIAAHCRNLTSYHCCFLGEEDDGFARVLLNSPGLQKLKIEGHYYGSLLTHTRLASLRQLEFVTKCDFDHVLPAFARVAPNLEKILLGSTSQRITELEGTTILAVARWCPKLRTFSARILHLGNNDDHLKDFLQLCPNIVNLDLQSHFNLTDEALMEALSSLKELHSINLSFCWELTNLTLTFLSERFAHSLQVLHLGENQMTQNAINTLRSKCTKLHTYHYLYDCSGGGEDFRLLDELPRTTILSILYLSNDTELVVFAKYAPQLQVLDFSQAQQDTSKDNLGALQLMQVAEKCPNLHTIVMSMDPHHQVNYSAVKKAYPKLLFTTDKMRADFDALSMPV